MQLKVSALHGLNYGKEEFKSGCFVD